MANHRINDGLAKAAPLCSAPSATRLCGALGGNAKGGRTMSFWKKLFGSKEPAPTRSAPATPKSDKHVVVVTTSFPNQEAAEGVLATSTDSKARLEAATALGKTNAPQVVPSLAQALLSDKDKYVRGACAGYLGMIMGADAENSLLQAMSDRSPYVRKKVVEALFRLGTEQAGIAIDAAGKDANSEVRAEAKRYASKTTKKIQKRLCPFLSEFGMCEPPGVGDLYECSWETQGSGHYIGCFVYKMHTHRGGPGDFLRRM